MVMLHNLPRRRSQLRAQACDIVKKRRRQLFETEDPLNRTCSATTIEVAAAILSNASFAIFPVARAPRRTRRQRGPTDRMRYQRSSSRPRFGALPARRNAGAHHRYARNCERRTARRRALRRIFQALHARLQLPAVLRRRMQALPRRRTPQLGTATWLS